MRPKILVITPVRHIQGVAETLEASGEVTYLDDPTPAQVLDRIEGHAALFTNPNKSNVFISRQLMDAGESLSVICTASTGTNHIDMRGAQERGLTVLSLTEERELINRISSTAEHAFALMMAGLRNLGPAWDAVRRGEWDYMPYIGRQLDALTIGVVGYGRLGSLFSSYCRAFGCRVVVNDPYKEVREPGLEQVDIDTLLAESDVISLHVHVTPETNRMVDKAWLSRAKSNLLLVNTARGDVCDEDGLIEFLEAHPGAKYATDVLANETEGKFHSPLQERARASNQILITPHIGGMTVEAQQLAYNHASMLLREFLTRAPLNQEKIG